MDQPNMPLGFRFGGIAAGIKPSGKLDLALVATENPSVMVGVYTQNVVCATSIDWNRRITPTDRSHGLLINSGNANACTGQQGAQDNETMADLTAQSLSEPTPTGQSIGLSPAGIQASQIGILSTGVIGVPLPMAKIERSIPSLVASIDGHANGFQAAAEAITTTDKMSKTVLEQRMINGQTVRIAAMAKGAGMIGPNMATMLAVVCTDASLNVSDASRLIRDASNASFNRISVEGHTSTNDALMLIASQQLDQPLSGDALPQFAEMLNQVCIRLAKMIPADGEGASHLIEIQVDGAADDQAAEQIARTIASSNLVKTAVTGADPNWGRIVSAAGYSGIVFDVTATSLSINDTCVFRHGEPVKFDASRVSESIRSQFETKIDLRVGAGLGKACHWTSDLTVDYVTFNSEYTT